MKLINTDGLALIGPGSEWLWTAISALALVVSFIAIYRQLRVQASANAFEQMDRIVHEWASEPSMRNMLEILVALKAGVSPDHLPEGAMSYISDFWESVGSLVRAGHVDRRLVHDFLGDRSQWWSAVLGPYVRRLRLETGDRQRKEHLEWLAGIMADMDRKAGVEVRYDDEFIAKRLDAVIVNFEDRIRITQLLRAPSPWTEAHRGQPQPASGPRSTRGRPPGA